MTMLQLGLSQTMEPAIEGGFESLLRLGQEWAMDSQTSRSANHHHMTARPLTVTAQEGVVEKKPQQNQEERPLPQPSAANDEPVWFWLDHPWEQWCRSIPLPLVPSRHDTPQKPTDLGSCGVLEDQGLATIPVVPL